MEFDAKFDYVIVGGGSAGCVLASQLTENPDISVCLLEYGGEGKDLAIRVPAGLILLVPGKPLKSNNWCFHLPRKPILIIDAAFNRAVNAWAAHPPLMQ